MEITEIKKFQIGSLKLEVHPSPKAAAGAAAHAIAEYLQSFKDTVNDIGVIFATGTSQLELLRILTAMTDLPWAKVSGFHLDEYIGIDPSHKASFRRYLRKVLTSRVPMRQFFEIDGSAPNSTIVAQEYARQLRMADPQLCLLGIGENGHLAFNDPGVANFHDPLDVKIVCLDAVSRQQQVSEGWFENLQNVPERAITATIPALFRVPKLILSTPGKRKAHIIRRALEEPISPDCPATILRTHPDATAYLDTEAAAEWLAAAGQK